MSEHDHNLTNEIDPLKSFDDYEKRQQKGLELEGVKQMTYLGNNLVTVKELPSGVEYTMEYLKLRRILKVLGFNEKSLQMSFEKMCCFHDILYDFDNKRILLRKEERMGSPVGAHLKNAIQEFDQEIGGVPGEQEEEIDFDSWRLITNQKG